MIDVYRISVDPYSEDLSGTGAGIAGGRWNRPGFQVLYAAGSRALATLEVLVHATSPYLPKWYFLLTIRVPEDSILSVPLDQLPAGWDSLTPPNAIKDITEAWLTEGRFLLLKIPSAVVAGEYNYLVNPAHARALEVQITNKQPFRFDGRLLK